MPRKKTTTPEELAQETSLEQSGLEQTNLDAGLGESAEAALPEDMPAPTEDLDISLGLPPDSDDGTGDSIQDPNEPPSLPEDSGDAGMELPTQEISTAEIPELPVELPATDEVDSMEGAASESASTVPPPERSDRQNFYDLNFNELDRDLTPEERQEWNSIYASYRGRSALSGEIIGVDPFSITVRNRQTGKAERETMYCAVVVPYRVRILIPASEMWEAGQERPDFVLQNMAGATIDFIIIKVDREAGYAIASRRMAARSQRYFFARRPALNRVGARIKCRMLSVGPRRCLVECYGHDIGLTQRDLRYTAIPDLRDAYHPGDELDCIVKSFDANTATLWISVKETESNPFEGAAMRHPVGSRRLAVIAGKYGGGVFCNLPDGTVCMCSYSYQHEDSDFMIGDSVMLVVQRYDADKQQMYGKILSKR